MKKIIPEKDWERIPVDTKLEKYYKPLIREDLYWKSQEIREKNRQTKGRGISSINNILSGIIKCPECNAPMIETSIYKVKKYPYKKGSYQCHRWANQKMCVPARYSSWPIKKKVLEDIQSFLDDPTAFEAYLNSNGISRIKKKETELKNYERKWEKTQARIKVLNMKYLDGKIKEDYYTGLLPELEAEEEASRSAFLTVKKEVNGFHQRI